MRYFCTYFDHHYLPRGLALHESLRRHCPAFELWVLCLSRECHALLSALRLPGVRLIALEEFEQADPALLAAKTSRSIVEYYFTCTPSLPLFLFAREPAAELVTYIDSDLFFFQDPEPLFREMGAHSIAIIGHRFPERLRHLEETGVYNVGWVTFRRDEQGLACLRWWRERCLEWCYDRVEPDRYGDQKYLNQWPALFSGVIVLQHKGANLAPWNVANYRVSSESGRVRVDEQELVFFHFHGFKQLSNRVFDPRLASFRVKPARVVVQQIFLPYWRALRRATAQAGQVRQGAWLPEGLRESARRGNIPATVSPLRQAWQRLRAALQLWRGVARRQYFVAWHEDGMEAPPPAAGSPADNR